MDAKSNENSPKDPIMGRIERITEGELAMLVNNTHPAGPGMGDLLDMEPVVSFLVTDGHDEEIRFVATFMRTPLN